MFLCEIFTMQLMQDYIMTISFAVLGEFMTQPVVLLYGIQILSM